MNTQSVFPILNADELSDTRERLHDFARVLGSWLKHNRDKRKHWWHASLRPTLHGFGTRVIYANINFEISVNLRDSTVCIQTDKGHELTEALASHTVNTFTRLIEDFLTEAGVAADYVPKRLSDNDTGVSRYSDEQASKMWRAMTSVSATMEQFRASTREECSPIQLWPHHFDLSLLWLPGGLIDGQDTADAENADQQMNFGFVFGDATVSEPYFYITAYPFPDKFETLSLPTGAQWRANGFQGVVVNYASVQSLNNPQQFLLRLWTQLQEAGRDRFAQL